MRWPIWDIQFEERVQLNGLVTRPDLEFVVAHVAGLCYRTKRVGVRLADGTTIYVLIDRLIPLDDE